MDIAIDTPAEELPLDSLLNHRAFSVIYHGHKAGASIEDIATIYKTTTNVIRAVIRRHHKKFVAHKLGCGPDPG